MGRTIHWTIRKNKSFTNKEIQSMIDVSQKYNSGEYKDVWTCENFWTEPFGYYPNWTYWKEQGLEKSKDIWDRIADKYELLKSEGFTHKKIVNHLLKSSMVFLYDNSETKDRIVNGFCKTQGNEYNSKLVYDALIEISKKIKNAEIEIRDEGKFLLCEVILKNGKAKPKIDELMDNIKTYFLSVVYSQLSNLFPMTKHLPPDWNKRFQLFSVNTSIDLVNEYLRDLIDLKYNLSKETNNFDVFVLSGTFFNPYLLCRKVNETDFADYKMNENTLMGGFYGEGFGLTDKDPSELSKQMTEQIKNLFGSENKISVLGEENNEENI